MVMPSSGPLNMGGTTSPVSVAAELGLGLTSTISMNQANVRTLAGVGGSGTQWSMSSLYGKSNTLAIDFLVIGGGGGAGWGGGSSSGSGGGGGGIYYTTTSQILNFGTSNAVTIGAGGTSFNGFSTDGNSSSFLSRTSGGGFRGLPGDPADGGAGGYGETQNGGAGGYGSENGAGNGAAGVTSSISGSSLGYGGGGGGATKNGAQGVGQSGGGDGGENGTSGVRGGGGGGSSTDNNPGGQGGAGIVVIRYSGAQKATGGTITSVGGYTIHTFTSSGTFTT